MSNFIEIKLVVPLYCAPCKRTSYRWWFPFDLEAEGCYHLCCMVCARLMFNVIIKDKSIMVEDPKGVAIGFVAK